MNYKLVALILVCCAVAATGCMGIADSVVPNQRTSSAGSVGDSNWQGLSEQKAAAPYPMAIPTPALLASGDTATVPGTGIETKIVKTGTATIEVKDVVASVDALKALAVQKGGYLSSSNIQKNYNNRLSATIVIRVPQEQFEPTMEGVKAVGTIKSVSTSGQDVTEEYVDLQAQKTSYQNQLAQYNQIMKKADKIEDVIKIQAQINQVQTALDRIEGRMRYLNSRIDLSTITVNLQEPEPVGGETGHSFVTAINEGISGFLGMIDALIILFFTFLPLIIIGGAAYGIYRWKKNKNAATSPAPQQQEKKP
ncbi:MAG: DUF4349 domain-containing protein [Methanoregula sp.]|nr:MAG: DUF4349 domain-containing protein [Methanoregula sp.]